jgi:hypothetical protein
MNRKRIAFFLLLFCSLPVLLVPVLLVPRSCAVAQTRYERSIKWTQNGLYANELTTSGSSDVGIDSEYSGIAYTVYYGVRIWVKDTTSAEIELTNGSPVYVGSRSIDGYGDQSVTWTPNQTNINTTDCLEVRNYIKYGSNAHLETTFLSEQLGYNQISSATWTIQLYTYRNTVGSNLYEIQYDSLSASLIDGITLVNAATPPTPSLSATNSTLAGSSCGFSTKWTDTMGLATTGGFILSTNNSGPWVNQTWTAFTDNPDWGNKTLTLNGTVGLVIGWKEYANNTNNLWTVTSLLTVTTTSNPPTTGQFQGPTTAYANKYFLLNNTITDLDGLADFKNASIQITSGVVLLWVNSTNSFSIQTDAGHYCTLDAANSARVTVNSTAYMLTWKIKLYWNYTEGAININGTVFDNEGLSGAASQASLFTFEHNLIVSSASVNVVRINPSTVARFSGQIYYQATSMIPGDVGGITAYVALNSSVVGSNSSIGSDGSFQVNVTSEASVGTYTYQVYSLTLGGPSATNQTCSFIVETVTITFNGPFRINVGANCSALSVSGKYTTDNSAFAGTITLNDSTFLHITVGRRDFRVASISGGVYGITALANNPTTYCIWEELNVTITANATNPNAGQTVNFTVTVTYLSDGSAVSSFTVNILRDSAHYSGLSMFTDHSDSVVTHTYTTENITEPTYGITAFQSNTATVIWGNLFVEVNQINPGTLNLNVGSASLTLYHCRWSSNLSSCVDGTIYVNGTGFSVNSTGWASVSFNFATVGLRVLNLTGASVEGVTLFGQVPANPQIVWNRVLIASGGVSIGYLHVGGSALAYVTVEYEYDLSPVIDGSVLLDGSPMTYNSGLNRWEQTITSTALGSHAYFVSSVSGNSYGITVINDVTGGLNCTFYANINVRTVDVNGNVVNETVVYMNNGTGGTIPGGLPPGTGFAIVGGTAWFTQTVSTAGWANWTGVTNSTLRFYAIWYGLTVNSTFTFTMTTDANLDVTCLCYPFTVSGSRFWAASNATIISGAFALNILTLQFSGPTDTYLLVSSCTTLPKYITNVAYDLTTDFSLGYLRLHHFGNATIKISYESWGDTCILKTDRFITSASLVANNLTAFFSGNSGDIGTVKVFCGTRGSPVDVGGFTTTSYVSGVLTGIYSFPNSTIGVWMSWTTYGGSIGPSNQPVANLIISIDLNFSAQAQAGQVLSGTLNVTWSGASTIYLWSTVCGDVYTDWLVNVLQGLPLSMVESAQFESVPLTLTIPQNMTVGTYQVPFIVVFANPQGTTKTFQTIVTLTLVAPSTGSDFATYIFLGLFGSIGLGVFFSGNEVRKRRRAAVQ